MSGHEPIEATVSKDSELIERQKKKQIQRDETLQGLLREKNRIVGVTEAFRRAPDTIA